MIDILTGNPFPKMPTNPSHWEYFWYQLHLAVPGFYTMVIGTFLAIITYINFRNTKNKDSLIYVGLFATVGYLGFLLGLRSCINNKELWNLIHKYTYWIVLFSSQFGYLTYYLVTLKKSKSILIFSYFNLAVIIWAMYALFTDTAYKNDYLEYSFGIYPVAELPIRIWSLFSGLGYILVCIPGYFKLSKEDREKVNKPILWGLYILPLLLFTNIFSIYGIEFLPLGSYTFIPLMVIAWGYYKTDWMNFKTILLKQGRIFYTASIFMTIFLFGILGLTIFLLNPNQTKNLFSDFSPLPLISFFLNVVIAILVAGSNPNSKKNLYGALAILSCSFLQLTMFFFSLNLDFIILKRIEQFAYQFFPFFLLAMFRFSYEFMEIDPGKKRYIFDSISFLIAASAFTPLIMSGYFEYYFGLFSQGGLFLNIYSLGSLVAFGYVFKDFLKKRELSFTDKFIMYSFFAYGLILVFNIPASLGIELYPVGNLQFIPALVIGYSLSREGGLIQFKESYKITTSFNIYSAFFIAIFALIYYNTFTDTIDKNQVISHVLLLSMILYLVFLIISILITRPILTNIQENSEEQYNLQKAIDSSIQEYDNSIKELESINSLQSKINSTLDMNFIFDLLSEFISEKFNSSIILLITLEKKSNILRVFDFKVRNISLREDLAAYIRKYSVSINDTSSLIARIFKWNKYFEFESLPIRWGTNDSEKNILSLYKNNITITLPITIGKTQYGQLIISKEKSFQPDTERNILNNINSILASSLYRSELYREAIDSQKESEILTNDLIIINKINQTINSNIDLSITMEQIMIHYKTKFDLDGYAIYALQEGKTYLKATNIVKEEELNIESHPVISENLDQIYHRRFLYKRRFHPSDSEILGIDLLYKKGIQSVFGIPLSINNQTIGYIIFVKLSNEIINLNRREIHDIIQFTKKITSALQKSFLVQDLLEANRNNLMVAKEMKDLNSLSKKFNEANELDLLVGYLEKFFMENFEFPYFSISMIEKETKKTYLLASNIDSHIKDPEKLSRLKSIKVNLNEKMGGHYLTHQFKRSLNITKFDRNKSTQEELLVIDLLEIKSMIIFPLIIKNEVVGFLDLFDDKPKSRSKKLVKEIEKFVNQFSIPILNVELIQNLNTAYKDLKDSQDQLIQSEKMAALGQLISGVAHEINTPLGAIKATIHNLEKNLEDVLKLYPSIWKTSNQEDWKLIEELILKSAESNIILSTKEERKIRKKLESQLSKFDLNDPEEIADNLVDVGIFELTQEQERIFERENTEETIQFIYGLGDLQRKTQTIQQAVDKASKIVFALKNYAHFEASKEKQLFAIEEGLETVLTIYENSLKQGVELEKNYNIQEPIFCYPDELNQIWTNLIHNALQAMHNIGKLKISIDKESIQNRTEVPSTPLTSEDLVVRIEDSGPGIPIEIRDKIFNAFFTTKNRGEGSGLGLHITRQIVEKHNGEIGFQSEPGSTVFSVRLPFLREIK